MSQTEITKLEKIESFEKYSKTFYNELFNKYDDNSTILLITNMLLNQSKIEDCEEYKTLLSIIEVAEFDDTNFIGNILSTIAQFLTRLGLYDSVGIILSYLKYNNNEEKEEAKVLCIR